MAPTTPTPRPKPPSIGAGPCFVCGTTEPPIEGNHVAGYPNEPNAVVPLCKPCHDEFTALQRSVGIAKGGPKGEDPTAFGAFGRVASLAQGGIFLLILAARKHREPDPSWAPFLDRLSRDVTDLAAAIARGTGEGVPLPDPLADEGDPA